jgi:hypothetical protein
MIMHKKQDSMKYAIKGYEICKAYNNSHVRMIARTSLKIQALMNSEKGNLNRAYQLMKMYEQQTRDADVMFSTLSLEQNMVLCQLNSNI